MSSTGMSSVHTDHGLRVVLERGLLVYIVVMFFCDIAIYLSLAVDPRIEPQYWVGLLIVLVIPLVVLSSDFRFEALRTPVFLWCVLFIALTVISYLFIPSSHFQQLKARTRDVVLLVTLLSAFLMMRDRIGFLRKAVLLAVVVTVAINLVSILHSNFLIPKEYINGNRPAGFYINPNQTATALICGMIVSIGVLSKKWRMLFAAFVFVGVVATFSREAILAWITVVVALCALKVIGWKTLVAWTIMVTFLTAVIVYVLIKMDVINASQRAYIYWQLGNRVLWFVNGPDSESSVRVRFDLLKAGWDLFREHPWVGNGIGSTLHWSLPASVHNMYLYYMDDYGVIGALMYPLLAWSITYRSRGEAREIALTMMVFLIVWGLFDHDVDRNYYSLFSIALVAAISRVSDVNKTENLTVPTLAEVGTG